MATPAEPSKNESSYFIDAENAAEMARLMHQDRLATKTMGGLFPEGFDLSHLYRVLDIACGPGGWALDVASAYLHIEVVGIDISQLMVEYARYQALKKGLNNAGFRVMNALKPLDFPDSSYDLVNARFISGFMSKTDWSRLLQECLRTTRPGGTIRLTEFEVSITNGSAFEKLSGMTTRAMHLAGQSFSPDGRHFGVVAMLGRFLREVGCQDIQQRAYVADFSAGAEAHGSFYQDYMILFKLLQPFLIKMGVTTQEEVDVLYQRMLAEMREDDFCALGFLLSAWGQKPQ